MWFSLFRDLHPRVNTPELLPLIHEENTSILRGIYRAQGTPLVGTFSTINVSYGKIMSFELCLIEKVPFTKDMSN